LDHQTICIHADLRSTRGHCKQATSHRSASSSATRSRKLLQAVTGCAGGSLIFSSCCLDTSRAPTSPSSASPPMTACRSSSREAIDQPVNLPKVLLSECKQILLRQQQLHIVTSHEFWIIFLLVAGERPFLARYLFRSCKGCFLVDHRKVMTRVRLGVVGGECCKDTLLARPPRSVGACSSVHPTF
jgi:hypothetical protein